MYGRAPPPPPPVEAGIPFPPIPSSRPVRSIPIPPTPSASGPTSASSSSSSFHTLVSPSTTSHLISPQNATSSQWMSSPLHKYHDHSSTTILPSTHHKPVSRYVQYKRHIIIGCVTLAIILAIVIGVVMGTQSSSSSSSTPVIDTANANGNNNNGAQGNTQTPGTTNSPPTSTPTTPPMTMTGLQFQLSVSATGVNDISISKLSTSITPTGATGISYIIDPIGVRGYVLQRTRTGTSTVGLSVTNSALGASYTKSLWIYMNDYSNFPNFMSATSTSKNETLGHLFMGDGQGYLHASHNMGTTSSSRYYVDDSVTKTPLPINTWTHVAVTYDGNTGIMTLYRNGIQTSQKIPATGDVSWKSWRGGYGTQIGTWDQYGMNGCVSDMMQFTVSLSASDIQTLYKSQTRTIVTTTKPVTTSTPEVTPKPVATSAPNTGVTSSPVTRGPPTTADWVGAHGIAYTGGAVMFNPVTVWLVFYGSWEATNPALTLIPQFVKDLNGSPYYSIVSTYYSVHNTTTNGVLTSERKYVSSSVTYGGMTVIPTYGPFNKTRLFDEDTRDTNNPLKTYGTLLDVDVYYILRNAITQGKLNPSKAIDQNAVYLLITSKDIVQGTQCDTTCGWHTSAGAMRYGWVGDSSTSCPAKCQPKTNEFPLTPNGDRPSDSMISMVAHELFETVVGPGVDSWQNTGTVECADICAWKYLTPYASPNGGKANLKMNGHDYLVQSIWVNKNGGYCSLGD